MQQNLNEKTKQTQLKVHRKSTERLKRNLGDKFVLLSADFEGYSTRPPAFGSHSLVIILY